MERSRAWRIGALSAALALSLAFAMRPSAAERGCSAYVPARGVLVAHAGGGLPDRSYANNRAALDLAASHGFTLFELDFMERGGTLVLGHEDRLLSQTSVADLMAWLDAHPGTFIVTDFKTDNVSGLAKLKQLAGNRLPRFIPQIYTPDEYAPVVAMGYPAPILTIYRIGDTGWQQAANALPLRAVTMPYARRELARGLNKPVFLHTVNEPVAGDFGLYTDCLVPAKKG